MWNLFQKSSLIKKSWLLPNLVPKKNIMVIFFTYRSLRALYRNISGRHSICFAKINLQLYMWGTLLEGTCAEK